MQPGENPCASTEAERALVQGCKNGDLWAFEELYRLHGDRMKSLAFNLIGNSSDAEDAVQETFLKVHRSVASFRVSPRLPPGLIEFS